MEHVSEQKSKWNLTDHLRGVFKGVLDPIGRLLNRLGLYPNTITILGLVGNTIGAVYLALGHMTIGGLLILLMGPVDALDGTMARLRGMAGEFGAFVDSVTDRYSELIIFGGLIYYYVGRQDSLATILVFAAAAGSVLVSYVRARAASLGVDTKVGLLTRMERYLVLVPALVLNRPLWGLWIIAILANVTALQRIYDVRSRMTKPQKKF